MAVKYVFVTGGSQYPDLCKGITAGFSGMTSEIPAGYFCYNGRNLSIPKY